MLDDSPIARSLKLGGVGLVAGLLITTTPIGSIRQFGPQLPGVVLGALLAVYFLRARVLNGRSSLIVVGGTTLAHLAATLTAFVFQLFTSTDLARSNAQTDPTIPTMMLGGAVGAAIIGATVLPLLPNGPARLKGPIFVCAVAGTVMGALGYALCLAVNYPIPEQDANWPGLAPLYIFWPAGVAATLGWVAEQTRTPVEL